MADDSSGQDEGDDFYTVSNEKTPILDDRENSACGQYQQNKTCYVYCLAMFAALGGFLFGYDTGVISSAMIPIKKKFNLSVELQEVVVSITIGGAILGSMTSAVLNEKFGRRITLIIASFVFTIGAIMMAFTNGVIFLILGRLTVGIAIGYASMTVPIYIAEAAPSSIRGQLVTLNQLFITFGQFSASILNGVFSYIPTDSWRYMLGFAGVPSFIMFVGFIFMPESPRWLINKGKLVEAKAVLCKLRGTTNVQEELDNIQHSNSSNQGNKESSLKKILTNRGTRRALIVGCGLQMFQQLSAINTVMYYSGTVIELAGVEDEITIIWLAAAVASGNFIFTLLAMFLIEKAGRRKLLLSSVFGVFVALCMLTGTFYLLQKDSPKVTLNAPETFKQSCSKYTQCFSCVQDATCGFCYSLNNNVISNGSCLLTNSQDKPQSYYCNTTIYHSADVKWTGKVCPTSFVWLPVAAMIFYLAMFAPGLGPMPWTINAEIYPLWGRSIGTSMSTATNWIFNLLISLTFLNLIQSVSMYGAFMLYAVCTFVGFIFLYALLPETKGKPLEEIEKLFYKENVTTPVHVNE